MSPLPPALLEKLARTRLTADRVVASRGAGERRSKALGSGFEFVDHRPYQPGDDFRNLDAHLLARLGRPYVRRYAAHQALPVTILLDASRSMATGRPQKFPFGRALTAGLAYAGLAGGDEVRVGAFSGSGVTWHPRVQGGHRAASLLAWLEELRPDGSTELERTVRSALSRTREAEGLTVVVSDWLAGGIHDALTALSGSGQEIVAVHLLAPEEVEPERLGTGGRRFVDAETGEELEITLDAAVHRAYREGFERWARELEARVRSRRGRYLRVRSDDDVERVLLREWRAKGLIV